MCSVKSLVLCKVGLLFTCSKHAAQPTASSFRFILPNVYEQFQSSKELNAEQASRYFALALFVAALPGYLFNAVHDMSLTDFGIVFLPVTVLSALALVFGYKVVSEGTYSRLTYVRNQTRVNHKALGMTREQAESVQKQSTRQGTTDENYITETEY